MQACLAGSNPSLIKRTTVILLTPKRPGGDPDQGPRPGALRELVAEIGIPDRIGRSGARGRDGAVRPILLRVGRTMT
jgi:hypothetical protein